MSVQLSTELAERIRQATGENVFLCYQCVKCTSGCPLVEFFDLTPNQVMRAAQLGMEELLFSAKTPWLCASCQTCSTRCPQGLDIARVMDFIVSQALQRGVPPQVPEIAVFNKVFLRNVNILGRAYELGLMAELDLRRPQNLQRDLPLGLAVLRHGNIHLLPEISRPRLKRSKPQTPPARAENEVGYYPGCSLHGMASLYDQTARTAMETLGVKPVEPEGWVCCGSTPAHRVDEHQAVRYPLINLNLMAEQGLKDVAVPCASCFSRLRVVQHEMETRPELRARMEKELETPYPEQLRVYALMDFMLERVGLEKIAANVKKPLKGLKVACYYGCLLTRPPKVTDAADYEYPMTLDRVIKALGASPVDWDYKTTCCGASLSLTRTDLMMHLSQEILENARARGADVVAVACPLCHINLESRQAQMQPNPAMPVLYFTQLMTLAFGKEKEAGLGHNLVDPRPALAKVAGGQ